MPAIEVTKRRMNMPEIKVKAKALGITPGKMKKVELIHAIQQAEGCTPCFGRSNGQCPYTDCCFMNDCLKVKLF
ncbi:MAG: SAP domain-containing protein [Sedimentisphaerales bacterium]